LRAYVEQRECIRYPALDVGKLGVDLVLVDHTPEKTFPFELIDDIPQALARSVTFD
jgi:hypothetical protein